jgi:hypothetical protein
MSLITVKRTFTKKYPSPYSACIDLTTYTSNLYEFIINSNQTYRQLDCLKLCVQEHIINECGCYSLEYPRLNTQARPCLNLTDNTCAFENKLNVDVKECESHSCPLECDTIKYDLALSSLVNPHLKEWQSFTTKEIAEYEKKLGVVNLTYDFFKSTWVSVKIYYTSLHYLEIKEVPKVNVIDLISQIGGSLGMFISFSVFTLFELIELVILMIGSLVRAALKRRGIIDGENVLTENKTKKFLA